MKNGYHLLIACCGFNAFLLKEGYEKIYSLDRYNFYRDLRYKDLLNIHNDKLHSEDDNPSVISSHGKYWHENGIWHRDYAPAFIGICTDWWIHGVKKTTEINHWIYENNFPSWDQWDDETKILFKLKFH